MDTETLELIKELNDNIDGYKASIDNLEYDLANNSLSDEAVFAINSQISWYESAIDLAVDTIKENN